MTPHDPQTLIEEPLTHQAPTGQILVWRRPKLLWFAMIAVFGLALPGFVLYRVLYDFALFVALPAACVATFAGILIIETEDEPFQSRSDIIWVFFKWGCWVTLGCSILTGPFFLIAIIVGLIIGTPWALWVGLITAYHAMTPSKNGQH